MKKKTKNKIKKAILNAIVILLINFSFIAFILYGILHATTLYY